MVTWSSKKICWASARVSSNLITHTKNDAIVELANTPAFHAGDSEFKPP